MIVWDNEADQRLSYEMKVDSAEQLVHEITAANEDYSKTLSKTDAMKRFENPSKDELILQPIFTIPDYVSKIIQKSDSTIGKYERLVFFLEPNSVGYVCARYSTDLGNTGVFEIPRVIHKDIFKSTSSEVPEFVLDIEPNPIPRDNGSYDVVYILQPSEKIESGVYWISFSQLCDALPIAVGLDHEIDESQIPVLEGRRSCPAKYFDVNIIGFGQMSMEYEIANIKS